MVHGNERSILFLWNLMIPYLVDVHLQTPVVCID